MLHVQGLVACWSPVSQLDVVHASLMFVAKQQVSATSLASYRVIKAYCIGSTCIIWSV